MSEIVLRECDRLIFEYASDTERAARLYEKVVRKWNFLSTRDEALKLPTMPDPEWMAMSQSSDFRRRLKYDFGMVVHGFNEIDPLSLMEDYFAGRPPFRNGKMEFPDAMIVQTAARHAQRVDSVLYLVSEDAALLEAVKDEKHLIGLKRLEDFFALDGTLGLDVQAIADAIFSGPESEFQRKITEAAEDGAEIVDFFYSDDDAGNVVVQNISYASGISFTRATPIFHDGVRLDVVVEILVDLELDVSAEIPVSRLDEDEDLGPPAGRRERLLLSEPDVEFRAFLSPTSSRRTSSNATC